MTDRELLQQEQQWLASLRGQVDGRIAAINAQLGTDTPVDPPPIHVDPPPNLPHVVKSMGNPGVSTRDSYQPGVVYAFPIPAPAGGVQWTMCPGTAATGIHLCVSKTPGETSAPYPYAGDRGVESAGIQWVSVKDFRFPNKCLIDSGKWYVNMKVTAGGSGPLDMFWNP